MAPKTSDHLLHNEPQPQGLLRKKKVYQHCSKSQFVTGGPTNLTFSSDSAYLSYITNQRTLEGLNLADCVAGKEHNVVQFYPEEGADFDAGGDWEDHAADFNENMDDKDYSNKNSGNHSEDDYDSLSLAEKLRRERQRMSYSGNGIHSFHWSRKASTGRCTLPQNGNMNQPDRSLLIPQRGSIYYTSDYVLEKLQCVYKCKDVNSIDNGEPMDVRLSPCGNFIAFIRRGNLFVMIKNRKEKEAISSKPQGPNSIFSRPIQLTFSKDEAVTYGTPDFLSMEEISRYEGYWFTDNSTTNPLLCKSGIVFTEVDERKVERYRIYYDNASNNFCNDNEDDEFDETEDDDNRNRRKNCFEDHRYPFAGQTNPVTSLGYISLSNLLICNNDIDRQKCAERIWDSNIIWQKAPEQCGEYLVSVTSIPNNPTSVICTWQNREQNVVTLVKWNFDSNNNELLLIEKSSPSLWINLSCISVLVIDDKKTDTDSFHFILTSERTGFTHMYLYRYQARKDHINTNSAQTAHLIRPISAGQDWIVESVLGVDLSRDLVYFTGTFDSPLERHAYVLPLCYSIYKQSIIAPPEPTKITSDPGMHSVIIDPTCRYLADVASDLTYSCRIYVYQLLDRHQNSTNERSSLFVVPEIRCIFKMQESAISINSEASKKAQSNRLRSHRFLKLGLGVSGAKNLVKSLSGTSCSNSYDSDLSPGGLSATMSQCVPPEIVSFASSTDSNVILYAALYRPDPALHGPGPYPLVVAVYGGPHVQRVQRSFSLLCADMRAQRLRQLGFAVLKCDNRGSSRRGFAFEGVIRNRLGYFEVQDQIVAVRNIVEMGIADPRRVGIYGWSYGGYLSAMCTCRAPGVFKACVAGAPVTSWDGYDTHYTERYMSTPKLNPDGYEESSVFHHVANLRPSQNLLLVHGLIDENVHYRHTSRLIGVLNKHGKDFDLLLFPDARHSPRKMRDRVYMEQKICDYFVKNLKDAPITPDWSPSIVSPVCLSPTINTNNIGSNDGDDSKGKVIQRRNSLRSVTVSDTTRIHGDATTDNNDMPSLVRPMAGHL